MKTLLMVIVTVIVCASAVVLLVGFVRGCRRTQETAAELDALAELAAERVRTEMRERLLRARARQHHDDRGAA